MRKSKIKHLRGFLRSPIFGEDLINSGDIKVDEIKKTSPPAEEPQSESQSPEETIRGSSGGSPERNRRGRGAR